jgi:hypothetical protein
MYVNSKQFNPTFLDPNSQFALERISSFEWKQPPLLILSHMDCLIHRFLVLTEQHSVLQLLIIMK